MNPLQHVARLKRSAVVHVSSCGSGRLEWQHWSSEGKPLLLLHGGFGSWTHWIQNIPELREHFSLWSLDLPGLGASADMPEPHTVEHFARLILSGINQHLGGQTSFSLAGFSFGALVGARLAQLAGSRCQTLLTCGAAGFGALHRQVELLRPPGPEILVDRARCIHRNNLRSLMFSSNDCIDELALYVHGENLARARFNSRRASLTDEFVQTLPAIQARLVVIWGSQDATAGGRGDIEKRQQLIAADRDNAEFHILDGVGHWAIGSTRAFEIMLTDRDVDAVEAAQLGIVSQTVAHEQLLETCYAMAERIAGFSQLGVELSKQLLWAGLDVGSLPSHMNHEGHAQLFVRMTTQNFEEAIKARKQGRAPDFKD